MTDTVLVTGISGYIGSHVAAKLLEKGYAVRGTVRNMAKGQRIVDALAAAGSDVSNLELVEADLEQDKGWAIAVKDCRYIQHIASPFPLESPNDREALVPAARAGAQRVLEHGLSAGAERIVLTSSIVSMIGRPGRPKKVLIKESDWSDPDWKALTAYPVSKTRAELSAWAYTKAQDLTPRLTTICPGIVLGPDPYKNGGASMGLVKAILNGEFPRVPKIAYPVVDIRDCAAIHVAAMTAENAGGRRLMAAGKTLWLSGMVNSLSKAYPEAENLPKGELPNFVVRLASIFEDRLKVVLPDLGIFHEADSAYVTSLTGVVPRPSTEALLDAAQALINNGDVTL